MSIEIERKFLVNDGYKSDVYESVKIAQGYLSSVPERSVRIRIRDEQGYITVKGIANESGLSRFEWEKEIALAEAESLLELCEVGVITKIRHLAKIGNHIYEIDEFSGENEGLIMAEIELESEDEDFEKPEWLGKELTGDERYYNAYLSKKPYKDW